VPVGRLANRNTVFDRGGGKNVAREHFPMGGEASGQNGDDHDQSGDSSDHVFGLPDGLKRSTEAGEKGLRGKEGPKTLI
jgi:hypothetical protein